MDDDKENIILLEPAAVTRPVKAVSKTPNPKKDRQDVILKD